MSYEAPLPHLNEAGFAIFERQRSKISCKIRTPSFNI